MLKDKTFKLKNSLQGALTAGGDPASSPLYVFGPFMALILASGSQESGGAAIWLAVFAVLSVSAMYRFVMTWVTDGSGGSGLSEEEFGSWAVRVNASITVIEYTLTFLVSIAALVTFIVDRFPFLGAHWGFVDPRTLLALGLTLLITVGVTRGSRVSTALFGPATALILVFFWCMIAVVIFQYGLLLPPLDLQAFSTTKLSATLGGFARILPLLTGIEIFANLVASYMGTAAQRSRRAFGSLAIVMGTTLATMLIVGPAIMSLADPLQTQKSVFTQTMDALLPPWLSYLGTLIGVGVLLSAAAASMQGVQNLSLGLRARHYIPAAWGRRNKYDVPAVPAWIQTGVICLCFVIFGTRESTFLALYAAGVFILLSMTGWAAVKRFARELGAKVTWKRVAGTLVSGLAALGTSAATVVIFGERFLDGAWSYFLLVPLLFVGFGIFKARLGPPPTIMDRRMSPLLNPSPLGGNLPSGKFVFRIKRILVPVDSRTRSDFPFQQALLLALKTGAAVHLVYVENAKGTHQSMSPYLDYLVEAYSPLGVALASTVVEGEVAPTILRAILSEDVDLVCMAADRHNELEKMIHLPVSHQVLHATIPPLLLFRPSDAWVSRGSQFKRILVPMDGSRFSEQVLPYVAYWAYEHQSSVTLISIPEEQGNEAVATQLKLYLDRLVELYFADLRLLTKTVVGGSGPARTILQHLDTEAFDLVAMVSHGRGGVARARTVPMGSVTEAILSQSEVPVLVISAVADPSVDNPDQE